MTGFQNFDDQFNKREFIEMPFGIVETVDLIPEDIIDDAPLLFAPGWRETPELQKESLRYAFNSGRRVITLLHAVAEQELEEGLAFPAVEIHKAQAILKVLETKRLKKVDVVAHSEGAINVAIASSLQPEKFRKVLLVTPAGLSGKDSVIRVTYGMFQHIMKTRSFLSLIRAQKGPVKRARPNNIDSIRIAFSEARALTSSDIYPLLMKLQEHGTKVGVLFGKRDTAILYENVLKHLRNYSDSPNYGFSRFATKEDGHEMHSKPKEVMQQVLRLLDDL